MSAFRLGVVLRVREMAEESARVQLGHALAAYRAAGDSLRRLVEAADEERSRFGALQRRRQTRAEELQAAADAVEFAERSVANGERQLESAARFLFEARGALTDASRRRDVVERLRDRHAAAERLAAGRREEAFLGELATTRHAWRSIEEAPR